MYIYPPTSNEIYHYGIKRRSGRYPYGSGDRPYQDKPTKKLIKKANKLKSKIDFNEYFRKFYEDQVGYTRFYFSTENLSVKISDKLFMEKRKNKLNQILNEFDLRDIKVTKEKVDRVKMMSSGGDGGDFAFKYPSTRYKT